MQLFDTQERKLKPVLASDGEKVRFYCCGPTVYGPAHIGNFRTFVVQDIFRRVSELGGQPTCHVRNLTDVDDKTIRDSRQAEMSLSSFTQQWTDKFHTDCIALNCLPPHIEPSAVAHIPHQIDMVKTLIDKGHAYVSEDGSVYFKISSFPQYGHLSHLDKRELSLGKTAKARSNADEYEKDSLADFVLWKAYKPEDGENKWLSPWGEGRPGWHLECSAMIKEYLGDSFDLHSGGVDLIFPHHENEVAQSQCAHGGHFANHWFHIAHLLVDGGKMSKSLGNMYTLTQLETLGYSPESVRYVLAGGYYRRPLNFLLESLSDAQNALLRLYRFSHSLSLSSNITAPDYASLCAHKPYLGVFEPAWESLNDDLNTPEALGHIFMGIKKTNINEISPQNAEKALYAFSFLMEALGIVLKEPKKYNDAPPLVTQLAQERWEAKLTKQWTEADELRKKITTLGWTIKDLKDGYEVHPLN